MPALCATATTAQSAFGAANTKQRPPRWPSQLPAGVALFMIYDRSLMEKMLVARKVEKIFTNGKGKCRRQTEVLRGVSLDVAVGEIVAVVGPSGSGKSTLLHCLAGLESVDSGSIRVCGEEIVGLGNRRLFQVRRDHIGLIFQAYNLIPSLSAIDNVLVSARLAGLNAEKPQVKSLFESLNLKGKEKMLPGQLSGGEQQRVAIARCLAQETELIFADEPTGALDATNTGLFAGILRTVVAGGDRSVLMVTHDIELASKADRVVVLQDGRVSAELVSPTSAEIIKAFG